MPIRYFCTYPLPTRHAISSQGPHYREYFMFYNHRPRLDRCNWFGPRDWRLSDQCRLVGDKVSDVTTHTLLFACFHRRATLQRILVNSALSVRCAPRTNLSSFIEGILPKGPYLPCVSMAGRVLLAGYPRHITVNEPWLYVYGYITMCPHFIDKAIQKKAAPYFDWYCVIYDARQWQNACGA